MICEKCEALNALIDGYRRERDELLRVNKGVARHGIITESIRQLTELLGIEHQNPTANETTDAAAVEIKTLRRERDEARAEVERLQREHDEMGAELRDMSKKYDEVLEANVGLLDDAPWADVRRAYIRGAEAMRETCAKILDDERQEWGSGGNVAALCWKLATCIRAMPIPEEP